MPTYEYECQKCGHTFEIFQMMTDEPRKRCPECRGKVKRLIGAGAGIIFKGSGFYETDYRSDSYKKKAKAEKGKPVDKSNAESSTKSTTASTETKKDSGSGDKSSGSGSSQ
jgi:putative FmdB family regulatory protein